MAQSLTTLLGVTGAARFLQLAASAYRQPALSLQVYNTAGTTLVADVTNAIIRASLEFTDETAAQQAHFTIENHDGRFDLYGGNQSSVFALNNRLVFKKGLIDPLSGTVYLLPAWVGLVSQVSAEYDRQQNLPALTVTGLDLLKNPIRQRITTDAYYNQTPDQIATDVAVRYAGFTASELALGGTAAGLPAFPISQFPDMTVLDILKMLYDPALFYVRIREDGSLETGPRLGSSYSAMSGILGYPDQLTAPPAAALAYTFPDSGPVISSEQSWKDYAAVNQVRVLGIAGSQIVTLGPVQELASVNPSSVGPDQTSVLHLPYSDNNGGQNAVIGKGVYADVSYSTDGSTFTTVRLGSGGVSSAKVINSDGHLCGVVSILSTGPTMLNLQIAGYQYSAGGGFSGPVRHHGGFDYSVVVYGQPQVSASPAITAIADYNPVAVAGESPANDFNDGQIFQLAHSPVAMGTPVELQIDPVALPTELTLGAARVGDNSIILNYTGANAPQSGQTLKMTTGEYLTLATPPSPVVSGASWGLSNPIANAYAAGTAPGEVFSGVVSDDYANLSPLFKLDYERGRIVLQTLIYREITGDAATPNMTLTTTTVPSSGSPVVDSSNIVFNLLGLAIQTPLALYQTFRQNNLLFTFTGLNPGAPYSLRMHAVDPFSDGPGQRRFSVIWDSTELVSGLDVWQHAGGGFTQNAKAPGILGFPGNNNNAYQQEVHGLVADTNGQIVVSVGQNDSQLGNPGRGFFLDSCTNNGDGTGNDATMGCVCGLEVIQPQGQGAEPFAVNVGGPTLNASPPQMSVNYGYSPIQQQYGIQSMEIDNPLLRDRATCQQVAQFYLNYSAWSKSQITLRSHSVAHLEAGDLVKFYNPKTNADIWTYVEKITRSVNRAQQAGDVDEYSLYVIFAQVR